MVKATKYEGTPARTRTTELPVSDFRNFREGDIVHYVFRSVNGVAVKRTEETPATPDTYSLELSQDEAQFLADLTYKIGGDPDVSRRKFSDRLAEALALVGVEPLAGEYGRFGHQLPDLARPYFLRFDDGPDNPYTEF